jgi:hypothetical protein
LCGGEEAGGGGGGRRKCAGVPNQKQEPHTKMWGKIFACPVSTFRTPEATIGVKFSADP